MKRILLLFITVAAAISCSRSTKIIVSTRPEINYVTHLYTLANLGFEDEEYSGLYGNTLPEESEATLRKYTDLLEHGKGQGGALSGCFFFGVADGRFKNSAEMQTYFNNVASSGEIQEEYRAAFDSIANVYVSNYDKYLSDIYPEVKSQMQERMDLLNASLEGNTIVEDWQRETGIKWKHGDYTFLLFRAGQNGPSYNNLNENTNTLYYNQDTNYTLAMFNHEFGIFLLMDSIVKEYSHISEICAQLPEEYAFVPWSDFESLSCWYGSRIAGHKSLDFFNFQEAEVFMFCTIFDKLSKNGISDPASLYREAALEFINKTSNQ